MSRQTIPSQSGAAHLASNECPWETARCALQLAAAENALGLRSTVLTAPGSWCEKNAPFFGVTAAPADFGSPINPLAWSKLGGAAKKTGLKTLHAHDRRSVRLMPRAAWFAGASGAATAYWGGKPDVGLFVGKADVVFCPSETVHSAAGGKKARLLQAGVDLAAHKRAAAERDAKRKQARERYCPDKEKPLFVAAIAPFEEEGGLRGLIEAMPGIVAKLPQTHLLLMGDGALHPELARLARVTALDDHITFLDPDPDLASLLAACDVFAATATGDASGLALREAMAAGKAVAAVDSGCHAELIEAEKTGIVYPARDAEALAKSVLDLLENRNRRDHLGRMAAAKAAKAFDLTKTAAETAAAYEELSKNAK
ncbi:MAG: glycosyltransferase family 4 protein [Planctomycetota bacterium]|jgi:glycosyltransferase involved in cell wall biosynthesis|nr:glycosyltransferase family 4 protein [Planctomycetota bacterium]